MLLGCHHSQQRLRVRNQKGARYGEQREGGRVGRCVPLCSRSVKGEPNIARGCMISEVALH